MSRKVALGQAFRAILSFAVSAHKRSKQSRDELEKWLRNENLSHFPKSHIRLAIDSPLAIFSIEVVGFEV
jgi:hypothetical protein